MLLVHLDRGKDFSDKPEGGQRTNSSEEQQHSETDQEHVAKIEQVGHEHSTRLQRSEPKHAVDKGVSSRAPGREEGKPPPPMIFRAQLVIDQENSSFGAGNNQDEVDNQRKSKDIVELVHPQTRHDEKELHVGCRKRNDTS